jgi:hypothetical protein
MSRYFEDHKHVRYGAPGGSDSTAPSFNRQQYVRYDSLRGAKDLGAWRNLSASLEGIIGSESGSSTLFVRLELLTRSRLRGTLDPINPFTDRWLQLSLLKADGSPVFLGEDGQARTSADPPAPGNAGDTFLEAGVYTFVIASSQWQKVPFRLLLQLEGETLLGTGLLTGSGSIDALLSVSTVRLAAELLASGSISGALSIPAPLLLTGSPLGSGVISATLLTRTISLASTVSGDGTVPGALSIPAPLQLAATVTGSGFSGSQLTSGPLFDALILAGGGGGGGGNAGNTLPGGGGGGGIRFVFNITEVQIFSAVAVIGAGGAGAIGRGFSGGNSSLALSAGGGTTVSDGGGGGGSGDSDGNLDGRAGASGGGGGADPIDQGVGGNRISGQGSVGGRGTTGEGSGGGGGYSAAGTNGIAGGGGTGGNGGAGYDLSLFAGGISLDIASGAPGVGTGNSGTRGGTSVGTAGVNSPANRGGGGWPRGGSNGTGAGRSGGSGLIVLRHRGSTPRLSIPGVTPETRTISATTYQVYGILVDSTISLL